MPPLVAWPGFRVGVLNVLDSVRWTTEARRRTFKSRIDSSPEDGDATSEGAVMPPSPDLEVLRRASG